jgi:general secretion pathway protein D
MRSFLRPILKGKTVLSGVSLVLAMYLYPSQAFAMSECDDKVFSNLSANRGTTIAQLLEQLSSRCSFSIAIKDNGAENIVATKGLNTINLKDFTLQDVFDFLLTENKLDYEYQNGVLRISSYTTKTFKVDYITAVRSAETTFLLGNGGGSATTTSTTTSGQQGIPNSSSSVGSTFKANDSDSKFWDSIKNDLSAILKPDFATLENAVEWRTDAQNIQNKGGMTTDKETASTQKRSESTQLKSNDLIINPQAGLITITANKAKLKEVEKYINAVIDRLHKQVLIDVQILEVTMTNGQTTGIDWNQIYNLQNMNIQYGVNLGKTNNSGGSTANSSGNTNTNTTDNTTTNSTGNTVNNQSGNTSSLGTAYNDTTTTTTTPAVNTSNTTSTTTTPPGTTTTTTTTVNNPATITTAGVVTNTPRNDTTAITTNNTSGNTVNNNNTLTSAINNSISKGSTFTGNLADTFSRTGTLSLSGGVQIQDIIKFLKTQGTVRSVSNPKILTLNNQPALITSGDVIFYPKVSGGTSSTATTGATNPSVETVSLPVGVTLDITPEIMDESSVLLKINPTSSSCKLNGCPLQQVLVGGVIYNIAPNLAQKQLSSVVKASDGDRIILGGLIQETSNGNTTKIPGVGDIPLAGYLFKQDVDAKELKEMVIIITPHIIKKEKTLSLKELGYKSDFDK